MSEINMGVLVKTKLIWWKRKVKLCSKERSWKCKMSNDEVIWNCLCNVYLFTGNHLEGTCHQSYLQVQDSFLQEWNRYKQILQCSKMQILKTIKICMHNFYKVFLTFEAQKIIWSRTLDVFLVQVNTN